jgi:hypothetical protein
MTRLTDELIRDLSYLFTARRGYGVSGTRFPACKDRRSKSLPHGLTV